MTEAKEPKWLQLWNQLVVESKKQGAKKND